MDPEARARRQSLRVIISESIMIIAVIVTVILLVFLVSGYGINSDFEVERQGMLQIYSIPTGASVEVDGEAPWYQRTNTSKVLSAGQHEISLVRDGYDTWSKTVNINEGLLYRLHYPRLFLLEREVDPVLDVSKYAFATVSPDRKTLLLANGTSEWALVNLDAETPKLKLLDVSALLAPGEVLAAEWDNNNDRVLLRTSTTTAEWVLLSINNIADSVNITRTFATKFDDVRVYDSSANNLLAIQNGDLYKIDVSAKQLSAAIAENVTDFGFYENEVVFVAKTNADASYVYTAESDTATDAAEYYVGLTKVGSDVITTLSPATADATVYLSRFYDDKYITTISGQNITIYRRHDFAKVLESSLSFMSKAVKVGISGDFVFIANGDNAATVDMEVMALYEWRLDSPRYGWLDDNMLYGVKDDTLIVYDFDGLNRRKLSDGVSAGFPATITADKWLYYFSDGFLTRERITN